MTNTSALKEKKKERKTSAFVSGADIFQPLQRDCLDRGVRDEHDLFPREKKKTHDINQAHPFK